MSLLRCFVRFIQNTEHLACYEGLNMHSIMEGRELELFNKIKPYVIYPLQEGRGIRRDSPPEIVEAYEEFIKISQTKVSIPFDH